jgi:hypothetical protein
MAMQNALFDVISCSVSDYFRTYRQRIVFNLKNLRVNIFAVNILAVLKYSVQNRKQSEAEGSFSRSSKYVIDLEVAYDHQKSVLLQSIKIPTFDGRTRPSRSITYTLKSLEIKLNDYSHSVIR